MGALVAGLRLACCLFLAAVHTGRLARAQSCATNRPLKDVEADGGAVCLDDGDDIFCAEECVWVSTESGCRQSSVAAEYGDRLFAAGYDKGEVKCCKASNRLSTGCYWHNAATGPVGGPGVAGDVHTVRGTSLLFVEICRFERSGETDCEQKDEDDDEHDDDDNEDDDDNDDNDGEEDEDDNDYDDDGAGGSDVGSLIAGTVVRNVATGLLISLNEEGLLAP